MTYDSIGTRGAATVGMGEASASVRKLVDMIERAVIGRRQAVELATSAFLAGGHLLIEDVPGVGKTTLARSLARASGGKFRRIQFTSDLLPADITGISVWDAKAGEFLFKPGPVFGNVVLADEINRSTPKTQSALLEAMSEGRVSIDGVSMELPHPFTVIATQNQQEQHGAYPLPESQLDRFLMCIAIGYPDPVAERQIINRRSLKDPVELVDTVLSPSDVQALWSAVDAIAMDNSVLDYLISIVEYSRRTELLSLGVGPRGGMALHRTARALALLRGRDYCIIDDVRDLAGPILAHRVTPQGSYLNDAGSRKLAQSAIEEIVRNVEIPI